MAQRNIIDTIAAKNVSFQARRNFKKAYRILPGLPKGADMVLPSCEEVPGQAGYKPMSSILDHGKLRIHLINEIDHGTDATDHKGCHHPSLLVSSGEVSLHEE